jgi:hypothetical protein
MSRIEGCRTEGLAREVPPHVARLNIDENPATTTQYGVMYIPTL